MEQKYPLETYFEYFEDNGEPSYCFQYENWGHCKDCEADYLHLAMHLICVGLCKAGTQAWEEKQASLVSYAVDYGDDYDPTEELESELIGDMYLDMNTFE